MKIIILFALASVGVCTESGSYDPPPPEEGSTCEPYVRTFDRCDDFVNEYANDDNCLRHALKSVPKLLEIAKKLICKGRKNKLDKSFGYYAEFEKELRDFLGCTGCSADKTLGAEEILGHLGAAVGDVVGIPVKIIREIIHGTGHNPALELICDLLTGELTSKCVEMISNSDLTAKTVSLRSISSVAKKDPLDLEELSKILSKLYCRLDNSLVTEDTLSDLTSKTVSLRSISSVAEKVTLYLQLLKILTKIGCIQKDFLDTEDTLTNVTPDIGKALDSLMKPLLNAVLEIPGVGDLVEGIICIW